MEYSRKPGVSPETALASDIFDKFCAATTLKAILGYHRHLCELLHIKPTNFPQFYPKLKSKLKSWKAQALWTKFDKKASHKCYNRGKACPNTRVLIIGAGPCGLRAAIEAQLLGAKVVVVEKRDKISRNNVLHLWPFVIQDLRALGAKKFFGRFCAGSIDHISIRQLQCILLKVALILGVEIHEGIGFESLLPPPDDQSEERIGWRAAISPPEHPVSQYEFDVLIGADGKRNTLEGFGRKEFRGKLAIAITANFINKRTRAEARVAEISGVAFIFNQKFFKDLYAETGIDLENIVYYKDDTHYFVMTAKKTSLINKGVILNDYSDTAKLLAPENVDKNALMEYAKEAADFSTNYKLPSLEFAVNHFGQPDVAMFDFTSMYAAVNASRVVEKKGHKLFMTLVGDSLLEPFWPTGSGCARGFLSSMDACWAVRNWGSGQMNPLEVLAERESIYRILGQTTPENLNRDFSSYTLDPHTRYPNLNTRAVLPVQVKNLYSTDEPANVEACLKAPSNSSHLEQPKKRRRKDSQVHPDTLLQWLKRQVVLLNDIHITDFTSSFKDGRALCGIIHRYRPDLIDFHSLRSQDVAKNNQLAFDILERELGIPPVMTGHEMEECDVPDKLTMLSYLSQVYDLFRGEIPHIKHPKLEELNVSTREELTTSRFKSDTSVKASHVSLLAHLTNQQSPKSRPPETLKLPQKLHITSPTTNDTNTNTAQRRRKRRSGVVPGTVDRDPHFVSGAKKGAVVEDFDGRIKNIEAKLKGVGPGTDKKPKDLLRAIGKIEKTDWNFKEIEKKIEESKWGKASKQQRVEKVPKWSRQQFVDKFSAVERKLLRKSKDDETAKKYAEIDLSLKKLTQKIKDGSTLEQGERGANKVSAMAAQLTKAVEPEKSVLQKSNSKSSLVVPAGSASELCHFCNKRVYLMERLSAEGRFFHRGCFRCEYCSITLRLGNYAFDRDGKFGNRFFCPQHFGMSGTQQKRAYRRKSEELRNLANKENILKSSNQPKTPEVAKLERDTLDRGGTPERIEFENLDPDAEEDGEAIPSEMDEDEWTDRNFGASTGDGEIGSSEELSDLSESEDDSEDDDQEGFAEALDVPLTADETRRLAEDWTRRYSNHKSGKSPGTTAKEEDGEDSESAHESDDSQGRYSTQEYDSEDDESETATEGEEELKARELRKQEVRVDIVERKGRAESESDTEVMFHSPLDSSYYNSPSSLSLLSASDYPTPVDRRARFSSPVGGANKNYRALSLVSLFERGTEVQQEFRPSTSMPSLVIQGALPLGDIDSSTSAVPTVLVSRSESIKSSEDKSSVEVVPASSAFLDAKPVVPKNLSLNNLVSSDNAQNSNESKALPLLTSVSSSTKPIPKNLSFDSSLDQLAHQTVGKTGAISCSLLLGPAKIAARNSSIDTSSDNLADRSVSDKSNLSAPIKKNKKSKRNEPASDGTASSIPSASGSPVFAPKFAKFSLPKRVPDLKSTSENSTPSLSPQLKRKISTKNSTGSVSSSVTPSVSGTPAESPTLERKVSIVKQYLSGQKGGKESDTEISLVKPADKQLKKSSSIHTMSCLAPPSYVSAGTRPASSDLSAPSNVNGLQKSPTSSAVCKPERPKLSEEEKKNLMKNFFAKAETLSKPSNLNSKKSLGKQGKKLVTKGSGKKKSTSNSASKTKDKDATLKVDTSIKSSVKPEVKNHWAQDIITKSLTPEISRKEYQNSQIQSFLRAKAVRGGSSTESEKSKSVSKRSFRQKSDQKSETKSKKKIEKTQSLESTVSTPSSPAKTKYEKPSSKSSPTAVFKLDRSIFSKFMTENTSNLTDDRKSSLSSQQGKLKSSSVQRNSGSEELAKAFDAIYSSTVKNEKLEKVGPKKSTLILQPVRNTSLTIENRSQDEIKVSEHPHKIMYSKSLSHVPLKSKCPPDLYPKSPKPVSVPSVKSVTSLISELNKKASSLAVPNPKSSPSPERAEHVLKASLQIQPQNPPPTSNEHFAPPPRRAKVKVSVTEAEPTLLQKIAPSTRKAGEKTKNECILM